jgi:transcription initiation factor IIE alpha subunit
VYRKSGRGDAKPFHQPTGSQTHSALAGEREKMEVSCVFMQKNQNKTIYYACPKCNVMLYVVPCFKIYHLKSMF